ncbi:MAG: hypothetical protein V2B19_06650 [Pseudomonadota bacterium]
MKVLFYTASEKGSALSIIKWVRSVIPPEDLGICRSLDELESNLRRQSIRCKLAVLKINTVEEMDRLVLMKNLLEDIRIILIVPNVNKDTVQKGHQLYPRFMTDSNLAMSQLTAVIKKNLEYIHLSRLTTGCENHVGKKVRG